MVLSKVRSPLRLLSSPLSDGLFPGERSSTGTGSSSSSSSSSPSPLFASYPLPLSLSNEYRTRPHISHIPPASFNRLPYALLASFAFVIAHRSGHCSVQYHTMSYPSRAKFLFFTRTRMSHIVNKTSHRRVVLLLLVLLFLFSVFPSHSVLWPPTFRPSHSPGHKEQGNDQIEFEGDILSSGAALKWPERAQKVKDAFVHAYAGYKTYAFGMDELKSVSNGGVNKYGSCSSSAGSPTNSVLLQPQWMGSYHYRFTRHDALDGSQASVHSCGSRACRRLELYGSTAEGTWGPHFHPCIYTPDYLLVITYISQDKSVPFFETQIRYFGGLLSSYYLASISTDKDVREAASILRTKAEELGEAMLPAFNTDSGLPASAVNMSGYVIRKPHIPMPSLHPRVLTVIIQWGSKTSSKAANQPRRDRV